MTGSITAARSQVLDSAYMVRGKWRWLSPLVFALAVACGREPRSDAAHAAPAQVVVTSAKANARTLLVLEIDGVALQGVKAWYRYGLLSLYTGDDPNNDPGQVVRFWSMPDAPNGQVVRYPGDASSVRGGRVSYEKRDRSARLGSQDLEVAHYEITVGKEEGYAVPVTVDAEADKPVRVHVRGTISAMTRGIKMVDGAIDRSFDHLDTIAYLTRAWIENNHAGKQFAETPDYCGITRAAHSSTGSTPAPVAPCSYVYRDDKGAVGVAKLWLEKREGRWAEVSEVKPDQLLRAHPIHPARPDSPDVFEPMALERFEHEVYAPAGGFQHMREPTFVSCVSGQRQDGRCEIRYSVTPEDRDLKETTQLGCQFATYLFARDAAGAFQITRTLDTSQQYDPATQQVVARVLPMDCRPKSP